MIFIGEGPEAGGTFGTVLGGLSGTIERDTVAHYPTGGDDNI
jgi:hypothetical protein